MCHFLFQQHQNFLILPLVIYENNIILGRANKFLLAICKKSFCCKKNIKNFPEKYKNKVYEVGSILSKEIINYSENITKKKIIKNFNFSSGWKSRCQNIWRNCS